MHVLYVTLYTGSIGTTGEPEVQVFVPACFEIEGVVAGMKVGEFVKQVKGGFGIELGVWTSAIFTGESGRKRRRRKGKLAQMLEYKLVKLHSPLSKNAPVLLFVPYAEPFSNLFLSSSI